MADFLIMSTVYVAIMCLECYWVGYMYILADKYPGEAPMWVKVIIKFSLLHKTLFGGRHNPSQDPIFEDGIELSDAGSSVSKVEAVGPAATAGGAGINTTSSAVDGNPMESDESEFGWRRGGRAFDRIMKVLIPFSYVVCVTVMFSIA
jgi:hypothetical protein